MEELKIESPVNSPEFRARTIRTIMDGLKIPIPSHVGPDGKLSKEALLADIRNKLGDLAALDYLEAEPLISEGLERLIAYNPSLEPDIRRIAEQTKALQKHIPPPKK